MSNPQTAEEFNALMLQSIERKPGGFVAYYPPGTDDPEPIPSVIKKIHEDKTIDLVCLLPPHDFHAGVRFSEAPWPNTFSDMPGSREVRQGMSTFLAELAREMEKAGRQVAGP